MRRLKLSRGAPLAAAVFLLPVPALTAQAMPVPVAGASVAAREAADPAPEFLSLRLSGRDVSRGVRKVLTELNWHRDLAAAAGEATERQRPILWLQMLGNLRGFT